MEIVQDIDGCLARIIFGFVGPYPIAGMGEPWHSYQDQTFALLKQAGIGAVLTLTEDDPFGQAYTDAGFLHLHEPIDDAYPPDPPALERALAFIDSALAQNHGTAVHCLEGRGRTGVVLCAWLAKKEGLGPLDAIARLRNLRPFTALSPEQKDFLLSFLPEY